MKTLPCGREQSCEPCTGLDFQSHRDVCIAVGHVVSLPQPELLSEEAVRDLSYDVMSGIVDDDDYVTQDMRTAAVESFNELINTRKEASL